MDVTNTAPSTGVNGTSRDDTMWFTRARTVNVSYPTTACGVLWIKSKQLGMHRGQRKYIQAPFHQKRCVFWPNFHLQPQSGLFSQHHEKEIGCFQYHLVRWSRPGNGMFNKMQMRLMGLFHVPFHQDDERGVPCHEWERNRRGRPWDYFREWLRACGSFLDLRDLWIAMKIIECKS